MTACLLPLRRAARATSPLAGEDLIRLATRDCGSAIIFSYTLGFGRVAAPERRS